MRFWKRLNPDNTIRTVESYSHNLDVKGAIEITKEEFDEYIASLPEPEPPEPRRDLAAEIDKLKAKGETLEKKKRSP